VLFAQQGVRLWVKEPLLGYGVGQFGGIVAFKDNPGWAGKLGFDLHGAKPDQVDSFWLHLLVETGLLGVLAYFVWLFFLVAPMVRARTRGPGVHPFVLWGPAVLAFSVFTALLSPALEDPLYPPLMFTALGLAWVVLRRGETADAVPATGIAGPAERAVALPESEVALPESETDTPATVDGK
jgi:O-antigen ligase